MKLTDGEKLIAAMLADLMERIGVNGEIDPEFIKHAIYRSDTWALKWKYPGLFIDEEPDEGVISETSDIMTMCRVVEASIAELTDQEKAEISERDRRVFIGFDGNEEPHYHVATTLIEQLDRYQEFGGIDLNSHFPTLRRYRAMLDAYRQTNSHLGAGLSLEDIKAILAAPNKA